ncbi:class I adenylate-forming enzyme family protein [Streptomyces sp. MUM 178J]|uniref:class I adenylate-forming enzyme family protein n=1 Tax=Streptomyces sp. MUM 178J TaxID=2791991 RepID=UPI001F038568|nr:AMP-binding protein [Streptomyces sp. MUM 178J]WRQ80799.1 AMP-binding protein [Streptomyces sp. MUM 178J]
MQVSPTPSAPEGTGDPLLAQSLRPADTALALSAHTVGSLLREVAAERPDAVALRTIPDDGSAPRHWTYTELLAEAESIAAGIRERVGLGARVAVWAPNVPEWPVTEYAAALAGVTLVALNPALRAEELTHALRLSEAEMLLHADRSRDYDMAKVVGTVAPGLPRLRHVVPIADWESLRGSAPLPTAEQITGAAVPAQIQFTSGTTGNPKAVLLSHQSVVNVARLTFEGLGVRDGATVVSPLPMFHTAGCVISCLGPLWSRGTFVLLERFDPKVLLAELRRSPGAVLTSVPTVLTALNDVARASDEGPAPLSAVLTGAAPVRAQLITETEELFSTTVFNLYGQTELASVVTLTRPDDTAEYKTSTVGRPLPHVACKIVDPETGDVQPLGVPGEICARGYQQMLAYYGDPEATAQKVDGDGWLHTGDLGSMDSTGAVRIEGRLSDIIIRGGENIAPGPVESFLSTLPGVRDAVVVGVPDERWGECVAAVLLPTADHPEGPDVDLLVARCRERLSPHKIPVQWYLADGLPLTASGKIQKFRVRELIAESALIRLDASAGR